MSIVIVGGNERMACQYEDFCRAHGYKAKVFTKEQGAFRKKLGCPDLMILFTNTVLFSADQFSGARMDQFDAVAFGCPAMGDEVLEETEFEPMFNDCEPALKGKRIGLFGSYGWGDGEWMRNWEDTCRGDGAILVADSVICTDAPDSDAEEACEALGKVLAQG